MGGSLVEPGRPGYELTAPRVAETPALLRFGSINLAAYVAMPASPGPLPVSVFAAVVLVVVVVRDYYHSV